MKVSDPMAPSKYDVHCAEVTARILAALETVPAGGGNFVRPWDSITNLPRNASTDAVYHGSNLLWLSCAAGDNGYDSWWGTYRQWQPLGRHVRRGESGTRITKWVPAKRRDVDDDDDKQRRRMVPRVYTVFAVDQTDADDGVEDAWRPPPAGLRRNPDGRLAELDAWIDSTGARIRTAGGEAYYSPAVDEIVLPAFEDFHSGGDYYGVALHELVHWTAGGGGARLTREAANRYHESRDWRAKEELVAELGAAMACAVAGLEAEPRESHAEYLASWLTVLRNDPKAIVRASSAAAAAVHHLDVCASIPLAQAAAPSAAADSDVDAVGVDI